MRDRSSRSRQVPYTCVPPSQSQIGGTRLAQTRTDTYSDRCHFPNSHPRFVSYAGADVCLVQRDESNTATRDAIRALGRRAEIAVCDLADLTAVKAVFGRALELMGGEVHIMVNCGGIQRRAPAVDFPESDWDEVSPSVRVPAFFFGFGYAVHLTWASGFLPSLWDQSFDSDEAPQIPCFWAQLDAYWGVKLKLKSLSYRRIHCRS